MSTRSKPVEAPRTPPEPRPDSPSMEDRSWCAEASERGLFRPAQTRPTDVRKTSRWGKAIANWTAAGMPVREK